MRRTFLLACLAFVAAGSPACGSCKGSEPPRAEEQAEAGGASAASVSAAPAASGAAPSGGGPAPLSLPIAADLAGGAVYVAGLVAARHAVNVSRYLTDGTLQWTIDAVPDVDWSADAEVEAVASSGGVAVVWRGPQKGKPVRRMQVVGADGRPAGAPEDVGAFVCATRSGEIAWVQEGGGPAKAITRPFAGGAARTAATVPEEREARLACGESKVYLLDAGDDDLHARALGGGKRVALLGPEDLGDEDPSEHDDFTVGDDLVTVMLTAGGRMTVRELEHGGALSAARRLGHVLARDEDVVAVDGDAAHAGIVLTRDASARCDGAQAIDLEAIVADRAAVAAPKEQLVQVAHGGCGHDLGPFWVGAPGGKLMVAWGTHAARVAGAGGPIPFEGLSYRPVVGGGATGHVDQAADGLAFAGCEGAKCYVVALTRPEGTDGMVPGSAKILAFP